MSQKNQINITENQYKVVESGIQLSKRVEAILATYYNNGNRSSYSQLWKQFKFLDRHVRSDAFFILLSAAYDKAQGGASIDYLLSRNDCTKAIQMDKYLDRVVKLGLLRYDKSIKKYNITKRGLFYLRLYALTAMDIF